MATKEENQRRVRAAAIERNIARNQPAMKGVLEDGDEGGWKEDYLSGSEEAVELPEPEVDGD